MIGAAVATNNNNNEEIRVRLSLLTKDAEKDLARVYQRVRDSFKNIKVDVKVNLDPAAVARVKELNLALTNLNKTSMTGAVNAFKDLSSAIKGIDKRTLSTLANDTKRLATNLQAFNNPVQIQSIRTLAGAFKHIGDSSKGLVGVKEGMQGLANGLNSITRAANNIGQINQIEPAIRRLTAALKDLQKANVDPQLKNLAELAKGLAVTTQRGSGARTKSPIDQDSIAGWFKSKQIELDRKPLRMRVRPEFDEGDWNQKIQKYQNLLIAISFGQFTEEFKRFAANSLRDFATIQSTRTTLDTVYRQNPKQGNEYFRGLYDYEKQTPYTFEEIMGVGRTFGVQRNQIGRMGRSPMQMVELAGQLAALTGGPINEAASGLSKVMSGDPNGLEILRNQFGISRSVLMQGGVMPGPAGFNLSSEASVRAILTAIERYSKEQGGPELVERRSKDISGKLSTLESQWFSTRASLMEPIQETAGQFIDAMTAAVKAVEDLPPVVRGFAGIIVQSASVTAEALQKLSSAALVIVGAANAGILPGSGRATIDAATGRMISYQTSMRQAMMMQGGLNLASPFLTRASLGAPGPIPFQPPSSAATNLVKQGYASNMMMAASNVGVAGFGVAAQTMGKEVKPGSYIPNIKAIFSTVGKAIADLAKGIITTIFGAGALAGMTKAAGAVARPALQLGITGAVSTFGLAFVGVAAGLTAVAIAAMALEGNMWKRQIEKETKQVRDKLDTDIRERYKKNPKLLAEDRDISMMTPEQLAANGISKQRIRQARERLTGFYGTENDERIKKLRNLEDTYDENKDAVAEQQKTVRQNKLAQLEAATFLGEAGSDERLKLLKENVSSLEREYKAAQKVAGLNKDDTIVQMKAKELLEARVEARKEEIKLQQASIAMDRAMLALGGAQGGLTQEDKIRRNRGLNARTDQSTPEGRAAFLMGEATIAEQEFQLLVQSKKYHTEILSLRQRGLQARLEGIRLDAEEKKRNQSERDFAAIEEEAAIKSKRARYDEYLVMKSLATEVTKLKGNELQAQLSELYIAKEKELQAEEMNAEKRKLIEEKYSLQKKQLTQRYYDDLLQMASQYQANLAQIEADRAGMNLDNQKAGADLWRNQFNRMSPIQKANNIGTLAGLANSEIEGIKQVEKEKLNTLDKQWEATKNQINAELAMAGITGRRRRELEQTYKVKEKEYNLDKDKVRSSTANEVDKITQQNIFDTQDAILEASGYMTTQANKVLSRRLKKSDRALEATKDPSKKIDILKGQLEIEKQIAQNEAGQAMKEAATRGDIVEQTQIKADLEEKILEIQGKYLDKAKAITKELEAQNEEIMKRYTNEDGTTMGEVFGIQDLAANMKADSDYSAMRYKQLGMKSKMSRVFGADEFALKQDAFEGAGIAREVAFQGKAMTNTQLPQMNVKVDDITLKIDLTVDGKRHSEYKLEANRKNPNFQSGRKNK